MTGHRAVWAGILLTIAAIAVAAALAVSGRPAPQHAAHRVACAKTEDSYLTDCHGHRLEYIHGRGWFAPGQ